MDEPDSPTVATKLRPKSDSVILAHSKNFIRPELLNSWPSKCAYVVDEILKTETDYLIALQDIIEGYKNPLAGKLKLTNEGHRVVQTIFGNVEELHSLHSSLLTQLKQWEDEPHEFGRVFTNNESRFNVYTLYCTNYDAALSTLAQLQKQRTDIQSFIETCQRRLGHPLPLTASLIKPVQRIMRYHLLLKQLVKGFDPNLYGHASLTYAHQAMARLADHINEVKKQKENDLRAKDIQNYLSGFTENLTAYGRLMLETTCLVGKRGVERQVILFEKLLLILKKKDSKKYNYKAHILTEELGISTDGTKSGASFKVFSRGQSSHVYLITTSSSKDQTEWVKMITGLLDSLNERRAQEEAELRARLQQQQLANSRAAFKKRPQTIHEEPRFRYGSRDSRRMMGSRKRARADIRDLFPEEQEEGSVELVTVNKIPEAIEELPPIEAPPQQEASLKYIKITDDSQLENDQNLLNLMSKNKSKSSESLLSLEDVELGVADTDVGEAGVSCDGEDEPDGLQFDSMEDSTPNRASNLTRRAAIKVRHSEVSSSSSYQSIIRIRASEVRRASDHGTHTDELVSDHQPYFEEESTLARILSSPKVSLSHGLARQTSQGSEQDSLYHSGTSDITTGAPPLLSGDPGYQVEIQESVGGVLDSGLGGVSPVAVHAGPSQTTPPEDMEVVLEDSSSESEDESIPTQLTQSHDGHQTQSHDGHLTQSLSSGELKDFFQALREGNSPSESHDSVDGATTGEPYQFRATDSAELYTTLPWKQRSKATSPGAKIQTIGSQLAQSTQTLARSRRADGFSRLLEFTRQQSTTPEGSPSRQLGPGYEVTQSLPVGVAGRRSLGDITEHSDMAGDTGTNLAEVEFEGIELAENIVTVDRVDGVLPEEDVMEGDKDHSPPHPDIDNTIHTVATGAVQSEQEIDLPNEHKELGNEVHSLPNEDEAIELTEVQDELDLGPVSGDDSDQLMVDEQSSVLQDYSTEQPANETGSSGHVTEMKEGPSQRDGDVETETNSVTHIETESKPIKTQTELRRRTVQTEPTQATSHDQSHDQSGDPGAGVLTRLFGGWAPVVRTGLVVVGVMAVSSLLMLAYYSN